MPKVAVAVLLALATACGALGAEPQRATLSGGRTAVAGAPWRATLHVRPAPRAVPRVLAALGRATATVRVRRAGRGYTLAARFPRAGRWRLTVHVGTARLALGTVAVAAPRLTLRSVLAVELHPDGGVLIADGDAGRVVRADPRSGRLTTFASAGLAAPTGLAVAPDGTVYVADRHVPAVFRVRNGAVTRFAEYPEPLDVAVAPDGTVFATGRAHSVVRADPATGATTPYAGTGVDGSSGDGGPALAAALAAPHGIAVDPAGNVVVAELTRARRIDRATGVIATIAGSGERRACGDRGPALAVCLTAIRVAFEPDGDFYVADPENSRLWLVEAGEARAFVLPFAPFDVAVESPTTVLLADSLGRRVVRYDVVRGTAATVAG